MAEVPRGSVQPPLMLASLKLGTEASARALAQGWNHVAAAAAAAARTKSDSGHSKGEGKGDEEAERPPISSFGMKAYLVVSKDEGVGRGRASPSLDPSIAVKLSEVVASLEAQREAKVAEVAVVPGREGKERHLTTGYVNNNNASGKDEGNGDSAGGDDDTSMVKLDMARVAAAAGGGEYDEEEDALNAPAVLEAVASFKRSYGQRERHLRKRRVEIVDRRLAEEKVRARERLLREREKQRKLRVEAEAKATEATSITDHAPVRPSGQAVSSLGAPPPSAADQPSAPTKESGMRGVSNLPAWMAKRDGGAASLPPAAVLPPPSSRRSEEGAEVPDPNESHKRKFVPSEANRDLNKRKQRIDTGSGVTMAELRAANEAADASASASAAASLTAASDVQSASGADPKTTPKKTILSPDTSFPPVSAAAAARIRAFVREQIIDLLGEEEITMIDFVMEQLTKGVRATSLLDEMRQVLDEDAEVFVVGLFGVVSALP